ncbi:FIG009095: D,D-carboxypeptidase family protein [Pseudoalteromonas luteoviolacea B = ATCC 29581]|nr:FIG009095: D,D-carboxypeptidase family protein [Pseudoalteromonas luteoviolacea B = ATCC 29581]
MLVGRDESALVHFDNTLIHHDCLNMITTLKQKADAAGFDLGVASGYRSFDRQLLIWNSKFKGERPVFERDGSLVDMNRLDELEKITHIMLFSALPGASRHHWGCDFDLYAKNLTSLNIPLQLSPEEYLNGPQSPFNLWLNECLNDFDLFRPYEIYRGGVAEEPWHISHRPVAKQFEAAMSLKAIKEALFESDIQGKGTIIENLSDLYARFVINIGK